MKIEKRYKQIEYSIYVTEDGKEFTSVEEAKLHEDITSGKKKVCERCNGKGKINERYEEQWMNQSMISTDNEYVTVLKSDVCPVCNGKKYLELKWV